MAKEYNPKSKYNYFVAEKGTAWVRKKISGVYDTWKTLGDIQGNTFTPAMEKLEHFSIFRGRRKKDHEVITQASLNIKLTLNEIVRKNLEFLLLSSGRVASQTVSVPRQESIKFDADTKEFNSGEVVESIIEVLHVTEDDAYEEGVTADYTVDLAAGGITRVVGGSIVSDETVLVNYFVSKTGSKTPILDGGDIEGQLKLVYYGTDVCPRRICIELYLVKFSLDGDISFPSDAWQEASLNCECLEDDALGFGKWFELESA